MGDYEPLAWAIGVAGSIAAFMFGLGYINSSDKKAEIALMEFKRANVQNAYVLQEKDLNGNGIPERFFEREGKKYFSAIDGKNLEDTLK